MMKPFKPNKQQTEALNQGATMLFIPIKLVDYIFMDFRKEGARFQKYLGGCIATTEFIELPLQIGQEYYVQEESYIDREIALKHAKGGLNQTMSYVEMVNALFDQIKNQIKFKVTDIQVERVQDLVAIYGELDDYVNSLTSKEYEDNSHGFLVEIKRL